MILHLLSVWILLSLKSIEVCFGRQLSYLLINLMVSGLFLSSLERFWSILYSVLSLAYYQGVPVLGLY